MLTLQLPSGTSQRLTEPSLPTWRRLRGRLGYLWLHSTDRHAMPSDLPSCRPSESRCTAWLMAISKLELRAPSPDHIAAQAHLLGVPSRLRRSELHVVKPHQRGLELPGPGGQLAHQLVGTQTGQSLQSNCHETLSGSRGVWPLVVPGLIHNRQPRFNEGHPMWHLSGATLPLLRPLPAPGWPSPQLQSPYPGDPQ